MRISRKRQAEMDQLYGTPPTKASSTKNVQEHTQRELDFLPAAVHILSISIRRFVTRFDP